MKGRDRREDVVIAVMVVATVVQTALVFWVLLA